MMNIALKILNALAPGWAWSHRLKSDPWLRQMCIFINWRLFDQQQAKEDESIAAIQRNDLAVRNQMAEVLLKRVREVADSADRRMAARRWLVEEARGYARIYSIFVDEDEYELEVSAGARHPMNYDLLSASHQIVAEAVPDLVREKGSVERAAQSLVEECHWLYTRLYLARVAVINLEEDGDEAASWMSEYVRLLVVKCELDLRVASGLPVAANNGQWRDATDEIDRRILGGERDPVAPVSSTLLRQWKGESPTEAPLMSFAVVPAAKMAQGESPFDDWRPPNEIIPEELESDFKGCVWLYQMYVFLIFVEARFGAHTTETILDYQVTFLDTLAVGSGKQMKEGLEKMKVVASALLQDPELEIGGKKVAVPLEYAIAYAFFPNTTWDNATTLVRCLEYGKTSARSLFEPFINATRIENGKAIVLPATQWER